MLNNNSKKAYSVILALLMTSFFLILVSGLFKLILENMYDIRGMQDYLKAYSAAEGSMELALKKVKDNDYGYEEHIFPGIGDNKISKILYDNKKDALIGYDINASSGSISNKAINHYSYIIYPLSNVKKIKLDIKSGDNSKLVWNIIGDNGGISGTGGFSYTDTKDIKKIDNSNFKFENKSIEDFLNNSTQNYVVLYNSSNDYINFDLISKDPAEKISLEDIKIVATAKVGEYKQNLEVDLNIGKNLNLLKYSILSREE